MFTVNFSFHPVVYPIGQRLTGWALGWASATLSAALALVSGGTWLFSWVWVSYMFYSFDLGVYGLGLFIPFFGFWEIGIMGGYVLILFLTPFPRCGGVLVSMS